MVEHFKSCCCCSLKTGCVIIGVVISILSFFVMAMFIIISYDMNVKTEGGMKIALIVGACFHGIDAIMGILLVIGSVREIPSLVKTWVVYYVTRLIMSKLAEIIYLVSIGQLNIGTFVGLLTAILFHTYLILVVTSYHTQLTKNPTEDLHPQAVYQPTQTNVV